MTKTLIYVSEHICYVVCVVTNFSSFVKLFAKSDKYHKYDKICADLIEQHDMHVIYINGTIILCIRSPISAGFDKTLKNAGVCYVQNNVIIHYQHIFDIIKQTILESTTKIQIYDVTEPPAKKTKLFVPPISESEIICPEQLVTIVKTHHAPVTVEPTISDDTQQIENKNVFIFPIPNDYIFSPVYVQFHQFVHLPLFEPSQFKFEPTIETHLKEYTLFVQNSNKHVCSSLLLCANNILAKNICATFLICSPEKTIIIQ